MQQKIRWGVLGNAKIGREKVIPAMQKGTLSVVTAMASRDVEKAKPVCEALGIGTLHASYEALLADPNVDVVSIATPDHAHGYQAMDPTDDAEDWWVQEVISHRGKTSRNRDCTPGYYNFEGEENRRQDGNYNGGFRQYVLHQRDVRAHMTENFEFTSLS